MENSFLLSLKHSINAINDGLTYCYHLTKAKFLMMRGFLFIIIFTKNLPLFLDVVIILYCAIRFSFFVDIYLNRMYSFYFTRQLNEYKQMICCPDAVNEKITEVTRTCVCHG